MKRNSQTGKGGNVRRASSSRDIITKGLETVAKTVGRFTAKTFPETTNAVDMLKADHAKVKQLFDDFEGADDDQAKEQLVGTALQELTIHAALEEEIIYPAIRALDDDEEHVEKMDEALEEHHAAKLLIAELAGMTSEEERYDAKFKVLAEAVRHHIEEEENEVLPKAEQSLDLEELGRRMTMRKAELQKSEEPRSRRSPVRKRQTRSRRGAGTKSGIGSR
jgi:hemerythrin-like domain-containing protein